jgi:putative glutamine transport system substrate-binding protein
VNPDANVQEGMGADLARLLAKHILGDENAIGFFAVTSKTRGPLLDHEEVDIVIATFVL